MTTEPAEPVPAAPAVAPQPPAPPTALPPTAVPPAALPPTAVPSDSLPPVEPVEPGSPVEPGGPVGPGDLPESGPDREPRAPRRPRPVRLAAYALVLGTVAGAGVGYAVQAQRPPTPLPPLQVARPSYPVEAVDPAAHAAEQPAPLAIDGDLTKLLITAPEGSTPWSDYPDKPSWISVGEISERAGDAAFRFKDLTSRGFRRAAEVDWKKDDVRYRVSLMQFAPDHSDQAKSNTWEPFAGDGANGGYKVESSPRYWAESTDQYYYGQAVAKRGSLQMTVEVFGPKPVDSATLKDLAKRQWERLV
ncbi:hypothetical protein BX285_4670 [Streptomyces sp. 1114.5]|uniref:hypothetical protein n=1 Tax=Streptomyces sp. 1114.5 TaxID=1938830 RepID=UPI000EB51FE2|nr:hypothetical protein [Streptomyces sp. 1114.5]RKT20188.1 hypothetical protein BX285_4670 [Streptomyces sp. 1114.5]